MYSSRPQDYKLIVTRSGDLSNGYCPGLPKSHFGSLGMHSGLEPSRRAVVGAGEFAKAAVAVKTRIPRRTLRVLVICFLSSQILLFLNSLFCVA